MKILIFHPYISERNKDISYENLNYGSGFSGTETAMMEYAKLLADKGHDIHIIGPVKNQIISQKIHMYPYNLENLQKIGLSDLDIFCPIYYIEQALPILNLINPKRTKLWIMLQWFISDELILDLSKFFYTIYHCVSEFVKTQYLNSPIIRNSKNFNEIKNRFIVIPNGINELFKERKLLLKNGVLNSLITQKKGNWAFFASFERGGLVALRIFDKIHKEHPDVAKSIYISTYYTPQYNELLEYQKKYEWMKIYKSLSKSNICDILTMCDYFVYPLVLQDGRVHHDTYGCVVLEAMARGVIVITWDVACMKDVYGDYIVLLPVIEYNGYSGKDRFGSNANLLKEEAINIFAKTILYLEENKEIKEKMRDNAMKWAHTQLWSSNIKTLEHCLL